MRTITSPLFSTNKVSNPKNTLIAGLLILALGTGCKNNSISHEKQQIIKNLNHLATNHQKLRDTLKIVGFNEVGALLELTPDSALNATVMEQSLRVFGRDSISQRPVPARVRLVRAGFITLQEAALQQTDLPSNSIEEKVLYYNEGVAKPIEFNENPSLYKHMAIIFGSDYEKRQFIESLAKEKNGIKQIGTQGNITIFTYNNTTVYGLEGQAGIDQFLHDHNNMMLGLIVLKGHFGMEHEFDALKNNTVKNSTIVFAGGCGSFQSTGHYLENGCVPITNSQTGVGAINDPLTFALITGLAKKGFEKTIIEYKKGHPKNDEKIVFHTEELAQKVNGSL